MDGFRHGDGDTWQMETAPIILLLYIESNVLEVFKFVDGNERNLDRVLLKCLGHETRDYLIRVLTGHLILCGFLFPLFGHTDKVLRESKRV